LSIATRPEYDIKLLPRLSNSDLFEEISHVIGKLKKTIKNEDFQVASAIVSVFGVLGAGVLWGITKLIELDRASAMRWKEKAEQERIEYEARLESWCLGEGSNVIVQATQEEAAAYNHHVRRKLQDENQARDPRVRDEEFRRTLIEAINYQHRLQNRRLKRLRDDDEDFYYDDEDDDGFEEYLESRRPETKREPRNENLSIILEKIQDAINTMDPEKIPDENFDGYLIRCRENLLD
jgi:hypothetical protein